MTYLKYHNDTMVVKCLLETLMDFHGDSMSCITK